MSYKHKYARHFFGDFIYSIVAVFLAALLALARLIGFRQSHGLVSVYRRADRFIFIRKSYLLFLVRDQEGSFLW